MLSEVLEEQEWVEEMGGSNTGPCLSFWCGFDFGKYTHVLCILKIKLNQQAQEEKD